MFKTTRVAAVVSTVILSVSAFSAFGVTQSANADDATMTPTSTLQSEPDEFVKYTSSETRGLPIIDNDPSNGQPDVMVCRYEVTKAGSFGWASLQDGSLTLAVDPTYTRDYIEMSYWLCTKDEMGPETPIHITVIRMQRIKPQVLTNNQVKLTNANPDPVTCYFVQGHKEHSLYRTAKVPGSSSLTVKVKSGVSSYSCFITGDGSTDAGRGKFQAK